MIAINPLQERGLERFTAPQNPFEMLTNSETQLASAYYNVRIGGDMALLKGMMRLCTKCLQTFRPAFFVWNRFFAHKIGRKSAMFVFCRQKCLKIYENALQFRINMIYYCELTMCKNI